MNNYTNIDMVKLNMETLCSYDYIINKVGRRLIVHTPTFGDERIAALWARVNLSVQLDG